MGKLRKIWKNTDPSQLLVRKTVGDETYDSLSPLGAQQEQQYEAAKAAEAAAQEEEEKEAIPLPDEEELARIRRRKARRGTGRESTVLSQDSFGAG